MCSLAKSLQQELALPCPALHSCRHSRHELCRSTRLELLQPGPGTWVQVPMHPRQSPDQLTGLSRCMRSRPDRSSLSPLFR